jgi:uncharacterized tellurite resistance protein B-like protein
MANEIVIAPVFYGISMVPKEVWPAYGNALLTIAGGDGDVSDPEMEWLTVDLAESVGIDENTVAGWEEFDYDTADLAEIFAEIKAISFANFSKLLLYDAIRMSYADGDYAEEEKEQVATAAKILKVNRETVLSIESLVEVERAAEKLRLLIL